MTTKRFAPGKKWLVVSVLLLFVLCLFSSSRLWAQATSGSVAGTISDPTGAVVPNANVTITDEQRGVSFQVMSNGSGWYVRNQLPNGVYDIHVQAQGFKAVDQKNVVVNIDRETRNDITMALGNAQQTVTVQANEAPVLVTDRAEISTTLPAAELNQLPTLGQNVTQLELLAPGEVRNVYDIAANENPQGGQANNADGLLFGFANRQIDGADDMDAVLGIQVVNPPPDSLDQMKVTTSNYDAEFGRAAGSFVEYSTKSGTNQLHGDLFEFLRNNYFDARNPYTEPAGTQQQPLRFNQFGGSLGGPIKKDKLFFFFTYQGQRQVIGSGFLTSVPTAAERAGDLTALGGPVLAPGSIDPQAANLLGLIPLPNTSVGGTPYYLGTGSVKFNTNQYDGRVDYYLSNKDRVFFRYDYFGSNINTPSVFGPIAGGLGVSVVRERNFHGTKPQRRGELQPRLQFVDADEPALQLFPLRDRRIADRLRLQHGGGGRPGRHQHRRSKYRRIAELPLQRHQAERRDGARIPIERFSVWHLDFNQCSAA